MIREPLLSLHNPYDALEEKANQSTFVVIDGIAIDVDNLIDLIHGREITPTLTRAELNTAYADDDAGFREKVRDGLFRRIHERQLAKEKQIKKLIQKNSSVDENGVSDIKLPRREQILMALSEGRLRYSSLSEFLGQFAELNSNEAHLVAQSIDEVRGGIMEAQQANRVSAVPFTQTLPKEDVRILGSVLEMRGKERTPSFLVERAVLEVEAHPDDFRYFEEIRGDRGVNVPFNIDSALTSVTFAAPMAAFIASQTGFITPEIAEYLLSPQGVWLFGGAAGVKVLQTFTKWSPLSNRLRTSLHSRAISQESKKHEEAFKHLQAKVEELKQSGRGRLILVLLKEIILAQRDGGEHIQNRAQALAWMRDPFWKDPQRAQEFEDFAATRDLSSFEAAQKVVSEFPNYVGAVRSLNAPFEKEDLKRRREAAKQKNRS